MDRANMLNNHFSKCFNTSSPLSVSSEPTEHLELYEENPENVPPLSDSPENIEHLELPEGSPENLLCVWKWSNIVPISKNCDKTNQANYRPIFLLPILSKPLERHIVNLLLQHLVETQPISDSQWGFQSGKSTVTALGNNTQLV